MKITKKIPITITYSYRFLNLKFYLNNQKESKGEILSYLLPQIIINFRVEASDRTRRRGSLSLSAILILADMNILKRNYVFVSLDC